MADGANATVVRQEGLAGCLFRLWIRPDWPLASTPWKGGQFVRLATADSEFKKEGRAYSFVGVADGVFEFYFVEIEGGTQTPRLAKLREGDRVWCEQKVQGHFTIENNPPGRELWMLASGAGIASFMAMVRHADPAAYAQVTLVHQVRAPEHLSYGRELAAWAGAHGSRRYVPMVSRPEARFVVRDGHAALFGRAQDALRDGRLERVAGIPIAKERSVVMLCGNPAFINDVRTVLEERGLTRHLKRTPGQIVSERYW